MVEYDPRFESHPYWDTRKDSFSEDVQNLVEHLVAPGVLDGMELDDDTKWALIGILQALVNENPPDFDDSYYEAERVIKRPDAHADLRTLTTEMLLYGADEWGDGMCQIIIGSMSYGGGELFPQDYEVAEKYYRLADANGVMQATINLGYVYEYGRLGKPDYAKAFEQFSRAAALGHPEAIYKLGDLYYRAEGVEQNVAYALKLYERAYQIAHDDISGQAEFIGFRWSHSKFHAAQAAFRIAEIIVDPDDLVGITPNPHRALELYLEAEPTVFAEVADHEHNERGGLLYSERLEQILAGQERARELLWENPGAFRRY